ncbi:MAG: type II toxin-antitoxin system RelE/ParE family toxin [Thermoplasmata archaeon]|nr:type II toxin-antitoxin system RelE/ParE family toxin [Thermoplasmata archaeon]
MFKISLSSKAEREIKKAPKNILTEIAKAIDSLKPTHYPERYDVKKLKGLDHGYRIRIRDWRILYNVNFKKKEISIVSIIPRKKAYKKK